MKKLARSSAPICLEGYVNPPDTWDKKPPGAKGRKLHGICKREVREKLKQMQSGTCAYCERAIFKDRHGHIEHFIQKGDHPAATFEWSNLFWSCCEAMSCGRHKDNQVGRNSYHKADLIKPDVDDSAVYFAFNTAGSIFPHFELNQIDERRALETIRVFNLNSAQAQLPYLRSQVWEAIQAKVVQLQDFFEDQSYSRSALQREVEALFVERYTTEFGAFLRNIVAQFLPFDTSLVDEGK